LADAQLVSAVAIDAREVPLATGTAIPAWAAVQAVRVGGVHGFRVVSPSGRVACKPAWLQSMARLLEITPDHGCPYETIESNSIIEMRENIWEELRFIYL
jgi:hypothetical protein